MLPLFLRRPTRRLAGALLIAGLTFGAGVAASAANIVVTGTADSGAGSLRQALAAAVNGDTITFDPTVFATPQTITLTTGELNVSRSLTLTGPAAGVAIDGGGASRVFEISAGPVTLAGLTIQNGMAGGDRGGGVAVDAVSATLTGCTFAGNGADTYGGGVDGAGGSTVTLAGCTFTGNSAGLQGGGLSNGGTAALTGCTFSGNAASDTGGGLNNGATGTMTVTGCTLTGNGAVNDGGGLTNTGAAALTDDILYGDTAAEISGSVNAASCDVQGGYAGAGDIDADPLLAPLGGYGGPTATRALLPGSPCLGAGVAATGVTADQRGVATPQGGRYDIGAFESRGFSLAASSGGGQSAPINTAFADPLVVTVASAFGEPVQGGQVTFTAPVSGASASLAAASAPVTAGGTASVTATAGGTAGGPYAVTAAAGGASGTAGFSLSNIAVLHTFPAGLQMIALDESYGGVLSFAPWSAPTNQTLDIWGGTAYGLTAALPAPGHGAWVSLTQSAAVYAVGTPIAGPVSLSLAQGWNLVGDPFAAPAALAGMSASSGGVTHPLSSPQALVYTTLYTYPAGATAYQLVGPTGNLAPFTGYWLYAFQPCTLVIPAH